MTTDSVLENVRASRDALSATWHLACVDGPDRGAVLPLPSPTSHARFIFGRRSPAVTDPLISREHLLMRPLEGQVRVHDCGSANGSALRGRRLRRSLVPRRPRSMLSGHVVEVGSSHWELRARPTLFPVPVAPPSEASPSRMRFMPLLGAVMLIVSLTLSLRRVFSAWGPSPESPSTMWLAVPLLVVTAAVIVAAGLWRHRRRERPAQFNARIWSDPAALLLTLAHMTSHAATRAGQHTFSPTPLVLPLPLEPSLTPALPPAVPLAWPRALLRALPGVLPGALPSRRPQRRSSLVVDLWNEGSALPSSLRHTPSRHYCRFPALQGNDPLRSALYWVAFLSLPSGGCTINVDPACAPFFPSGRQFSSARTNSHGGATASTPENTPVPLTLVCGNGSRELHLLASSECPFCVDQWTPGVAHMGIGRDIDELGAWWDYPLPAETPASWTWIEQCFRSNTDLPHSGALPECVEADALGFPSLPESPYPLGTLATALGVGPAGTVSVDMVAQGPHAVIVGTTGSGKSVALLTWISGLAARYSPEHLRMILIDYKGGATFSSLAQLPHVDATLTDLHPAQTERALIGVRTLLRQREHDLAQAGFSDLKQWEAAAENGQCSRPAPPRVLLACDEFSALSTQHPEAFHLLMSLAAQGRSLGLHILLATQRPDSTLTAGLLANIDLRLALRCREESASQLLINSTKAAHLPRIPGRAILSDVGEIQCAWIRDPSSVITELTRQWHDTSASTRSIPRLWAQDLPERLPWQAMPVTSASQGLPIGLVDGIANGSHCALRWIGGHIRLEGSRRNSATLAASVRALASAIAASEMLPLHVCSVDPRIWEHSEHALRAQPAWGRPASLLPISDGVSVAHLLHEAEAHGPSVIAIEDQSMLLRALERDIGGASAHNLWNHLLQTAQTHKLTLVIGHPEQPSLWDRESGVMNYRLLFAHTDHELQRIGATRAHPTEAIPGRALLVSAPEDATDPPMNTSTDTWTQVQLPLELHPGLAVPPSHSAVHSASRSTSPRPWCVRSDSHPPSHLFNDELHRDSRSAPHGSEGGPQARLLVGASLEPLCLPDGGEITLMSDDAPAQAAALGLLDTADAGTPTLLSPQQWTQLAASPSPMIIALGVREEVSRALTMKAGGAHPWIARSSGDARSGIIFRQGRLERCLLVEDKTP